MSAHPIDILNLDALADMFCFHDARLQEDASGELNVLLRPNSFVRKDVRLKQFGDVITVYAKGISWQVKRVLGAKTINEPGHTEYGYVILCFWVEEGQSCSETTEKELVLELRSGIKHRFSQSRK